MAQKKDYIIVDCLKKRDQTLNFLLLYHHHLVGGLEPWDFMTFQKQLGMSWPSHLGLNHQPDSQASAIGVITVYPYYY